LIYYLYIFAAINLSSICSINYLIIKLRTVKLINTRIILVKECSVVVIATSHSEYIFIKM